MIVSYQKLAIIDFTPLQVRQPVSSDVYIAAFECSQFKSLRDILDPGYFLHTGFMFFSLEIYNKNE